MSAATYSTVKTILRAEDEKSQSGDMVCYCGGKRGRGQENGAESNWV